MTSGAPCRVILIGMMGSGKSTIGRRLAAATGWPYVDNDDLVRRAHGTTARRILADQGEAAMRRAESDALALGLETPAPAIIGVAAGTILEPGARERLRSGGVVVWLRADAAALERRAAGSEHRPWVDTGGAGWIREAVASRAPLYASVAAITIDTGRGSSVRAAAELFERLGAVAGCADQLRSVAPRPPRT